MKETKKRLVKEIRFNQNVNGYKRNNEPDVYEINYSYWKDFTNKFISGKKVLLDKSMVKNKDFQYDEYWHYFEDPKRNPMFDYEYSFEERNEWIIAIDGFDTIRYKNVLCYRCYDKKRQRLVFEEFYIPGPKVKNLDKTLFLVGSEVHEYMDNMEVVNLDIKEFTASNLCVNMVQNDGSMESVTIPVSKSIKFNVWIYKGYDYYKQEWINDEKYIQTMVPELNFQDFEHSYRPKLTKRISYRVFSDNLCKTKEQKVDAYKLNNYFYQNFIQWRYHYNDDLLTSVSLYRGDSFLIDAAYRRFTYKTIYGLKYFDSVTKKRYNFIDGVNLENTYRINHEYSPTGRRLLKSEVFKIKNGDEKLFTDCILEFPSDPKIKYPTYYESNYYDSHCIGEEPKVIEALKEKYFVVLDDDGDVVGEYCYQKGRHAVSEIQFINQYEIV